MKSVKLNFFSVAIMYVGTIMGAGFASGREIWQFFGVFGTKAYVGVVFVGILFMILGMITSYIAIELNTNDMGRVIVPGNNKKLMDFVGYFMALFLFTVLVTMSAAGGSIFYQQYGLSKIIGSTLIIFLVIITVIGEFQRVSKVFRYILPVMFIVVIGVCIIVICSNFSKSGDTDAIVPSPIAPTWYLAAMLYISYNMLAFIPIVATASINAKNKKHAILGTGLGGALLAILAYVLVKALQTDMSMSQALDLPMLGYSALISKSINFIYTIILLAAVYAAATSNFYGFTTKIKPSKNKNKLIIMVAIIGFALGFIGFKNVVAYMLPVEGFLGFIIIAMLITNFAIILKKKSKRRENNFSSDIYVDFKNHDRFKYPQNIKRVTAGFGGESILVFGSKKIALYDCGMAYCHEQLIKNIEVALNEDGREKIDYVIISHSHYDHIGALPYILEKWPEANVYASKKTKEVFERPGALKVMKKLGEAARDSFSNSKEPVDVDGLKVDTIVKENDHIELGDKYFLVLETKGHTDCSLTFVLEPDKIMFASESTGILRSSDYMHTVILKNYDETIDSAIKCKEYRAKQIIAPHYGIVPEYFTDKYFDLYIKNAEEEKQFILNCRDKGLDFDEILKEHEKKYWSEKRSRAQPKPAYLTNAEYTIKHILDNN